MNRPCVCNRFRPGESFDFNKDCRLCWLFHNDRRYHEHWGGTGDELVVVPLDAMRGGLRRVSNPTVAVLRPPITASPKQGPCKHLGEDLMKQVQCVTCAGSRLKLFQCDLFSECTILKRGVGVAACCQ